MRSQLASFISQLTNSDWGLRTEEGTGNLQAGTKTVYVQLQNRVGRNLLSVGRSITYQANDSVILTLPASLITEGEDVWGFVISAEDTGNIEDAVQIAIVDYKLSDQISTIELPIEITFSEEAHLETNNLNVPDANNLPSGSDLINGQLRFIDSENKLYRYREETDSWIEHYFDTANTFLNSTKEERGANQELGADLIIPPLPINNNASPITTQPIRYWLIGAESEEEGITLSGSFNLRIAINGSTVSETGRVWGNVFAGLFKFQLIGYYRLLTRGIDTGMESVGVTQSWHPQYNLLSLPLDLPAGYAAVFDIWLEADLTALTGAGFDAGDTLSISFDRLGRMGLPSDIAPLTGDAVFAEGDQLLVLPNKILSGKAIAGGFFFDSPLQAGIFNSAPANTPNQVVILNGATGGTVRTSVAPANLLSSEVIRCVFSTEAGYTDPSEFSEPFILNATGGLTITLVHPVNPNNRATIRGDYSDSAIAGSPLADWNNPPARGYLLQGSTLWEKQTLITSDSSATQTFEILNLEDFRQVEYIGSGSSILGADFGLFKPGKPSISELEGGVLQPNTYQFAFRYEYTAPNNLITRIRHDVEGTINVFPQTLSDLLSTYKRWSDTVLTIAEARALDTSLRNPLSVWLISDLGFAPYILRLDITSADDGRNVIRFTQGVGGFIPLKTLGIRFATNTRLLDSYSLVRFSSGLIADEDFLGSAITVRVDDGVFPSIESRPNLIDDSGNLLLDDFGNLLVK